MAVDVTIIRINNGLPVEFSGNQDFFTKRFRESDGSIYRAALDVIEPHIEKALDKHTSKEYDSVWVWELNRLNIEKILRKLYKDIDLPDWDMKHFFEYTLREIEREELSKEGTWYLVVE